MDTNTIAMIILFATFMIFYGFACTCNIQYVGCLCSDRPLPGTEICIIGIPAFG